MNSNCETRALEGLKNQSVGGFFSLKVSELGTAIY